jgi:uncharacterized GH25 family protein
MLNLRQSIIAVAAIAAITVPAAYAHRAWMLPSSTVVSGEENWITVDAAISNDLFFFDHRPMSQIPLVFQPDGSMGKIENHAVGQFRATFDVHLTQQGTYRIAVLSDTVFGRYTLNGEVKQLPRGTNRENLAAAIPAGATDVQTAEMTSRNEIYVTQGAPTLTIFKPTGRGIEMVPVTHPNDLIAGEGATFQFLLDGKPAGGLTVTAIPGGIRYRDAQNEIKATTDAQGKVTIKWPTAGMWWVNVTQGAPREEGPGGGSPQGGPGAGGAGGPGAGGPGGPRQMGPVTRRVNYMTTLEVLAP